MVNSLLVTRNGKNAVMQTGI